MKKEENSELKTPFKQLYVPKTTMNLNFHADQKKYYVKTDVNQFDESSAYMKNFYYKTLNDSKKNQQEKDTNKKKLNLSNYRSNHRTLQTETSLKSNIEQKIPSYLVPFFDPFELKQTPKKRIHSAKPYIPFNRPIKRYYKNYFDDTEYYLNLAHNKHEIGDVDFKLISEIQKQQELIDNKINSLPLNEKKPKILKNKKKPKKLQFFRTKKSGIIYKYIPNSNKYKEINFHKECIFNNEFKHNNKRNISTECTRVQTASNTNTIPDDEYNIKTKAKTIQSHLTEIKKVLKQDKNFTHRNIERTIKKRKRNNNKEEAFIKKEIKKDIMYTLFIENKGFAEKVAVNPFGKLKRVLEVTNSKGGDPISEILASTLVKFCHRENFEVFLKNQAYKNNFELRLMRNRKEDSKIKKQLEAVDKNNCVMKYLERKINKTNYGNKKINSDLQKNN